MSEQLLGIYRDIADERQRQHEKWGTQRHDTIPAAAFPVWLVILSEEVGELSERILQFRQHSINADRPVNKPSELVRAVINIDQREARRSLEFMREEAIQCAAVVVSMVEHIDEELEHANA